MAVKDVVAEGRRKRAEVDAEAPGPKAMEPAPPPPAAPAPAAPAPAAPAAPKFVEGSKVSSLDERRPAGAVSGAPATEPVYTVTPDDGSAPYKSAESEMAPYTAPEEEPPMSDESIAPAGTAAALGLKAGATMGEVNAAIKAQGETLNLERAEARDAALASAGMKGDLMPLMASTVNRDEGQTWGEAVAAHKATYPSAYHSATQAPAAPVQGQAPAASTHAPKVPGSTPLASVGAELPPHSEIPAASERTLNDINAERRDRANSRRVN